MIPTNVSETEFLYLEWRPLVRRLVQSYAGTPEGMRELEARLQQRFDALLAAYNPNTGIPLRPYVLRHLTAFAFDYLHKQGEGLPEAGVCFDLDTGEVITALPAGSDQPIPAEDQPAQSANLREAIWNLPSRQRQIMLWRYYDGYSIEEIAARLAIQVVSARALLRRALNNLRSSG